MNFSATAKWIALALLGLAISAAVAVAASNLVSRQIGIASESISAGDTLAPAVESAARQNGAGGNGPGNGAPASEPESVASDEDSGGDDGGGGGSARAEEDRLDELEDAQKDREDTLEDALDEREDAREDALKELEDNSGHGSDD
ncbi:MAG TPA: hypothetical protein VI039_04275 [Solirubrobacterales bacterium]